MEESTHRPGFQPHMLANETDVDLFAAMRHPLLLLLLLELHGLAQGLVQLGLGLPVSGPIPRFHG